jgi:hypothetical protein
LLHAAVPLQKKPPVSLPGQQGCPMPPQLTHAFPLHTENGAVQPTPPAQHASPKRPQVPPWQPPFEHAPWLPPHALPCPTHIEVVWSQQPPLPHHAPSQHG